MNEPEVNEPEQIDPNEIISEILSDCVELALVTYGKYLEDLKVYSNPEAEFPVKNAKYFKQCRELHLGNKNISRVKGFDKFISLESLWLNNNRLKVIENLSHNYRIQELFLQSNYFENLEFLKSLKRLKFLRILFLHNNRLQNLNECLDHLSQFTYLEVLTLSNNPIAKEKNYREQVVLKLTSRLKYLDRLPVKRNRINPGSSQEGHRHRIKSDDSNPEKPEIVSEKDQPEEILPKVRTRCLSEWEIYTWKKMVQKMFQVIDAEPQVIGLDEQLQKFTCLSGLITQLPTEITRQSLLGLCQQEWYVMSSKDQQKRLKLYKLRLEKLRHEILNLIKETSLNQQENAESAERLRNQSICSEIIQLHTNIHSLKKLKLPA